MGSWRIGAIGLFATSVIAAAASAPADTARTAELVAATSGTVQLAGGAAGTRSTTVSVTVSAPTDASDLLRLSNDGGTTWVERPWTTSLSWSLIDAASGGTNSDGTKTVTVEGGDGSGAWTPLGSDAVLLDRTGPEVGAPTVTFGQRVRDFVRLPATDNGIGLARTEVSLDGVHWRSLSPSPFAYEGDGLVDVRESMIGGSWQPGERTIYTRAVDKLGNVTNGELLTDDVETMQIGVDPPATFEFPRPAVTGQLFTIKPDFDPSYHASAGSVCSWEITWGNSAARIDGQYNVTYGHLNTAVPLNKDGQCDPWTFTLPYSNPLEYTWRLSVGLTDYEASHGQEGDSYSTSALAGSFRATLGTTSRAITSSSAPLVYVLPDRDYAGTDSVVTYHLHSLGGASTAGGTWVCFPSDGFPRSAWTNQKGGTEFRCPVSTSEPYTAFWDRETPTGDWRAAYDPIGDVGRPAASYLLVRPALGAPLSTTTARLRLDWAGSDAGSGVHGYTLQVSRNATAWRTISLTPASLRTLAVSATIGVSYRFRVRATDRAGNVGAWRYSTTVRPATYDDRSSIAHWSSGWRLVSSSSALAGRLHRTTTARASGTFRFTGHGVGVVAPHSADAGYAQVWLDGKLAATLDLHGTTAAPRTVWTARWTTAGPHVVTVRVLGTKGHPAGALDGITVLR